MNFAANVYIQRTSIGERSDSLDASNGGLISPSKNRFLPVNGNGLSTQNLLLSDSTSGSMELSIFNTASSASSALRHQEQESSLKYEYCGPKVDGKPHGKGNEIFPNGHSYTGDFFMGKRQGRGVFKYSGVSQYSGDFHGDVQHGWGILTYPNGDVFEGRFDSGDPKEGTYTSFATGKAVAIPKNK